VYLDCVALVILDGCRERWEGWGGGKGDWCSKCFMKCSAMATSLNMDGYKGYLREVGVIFVPSSRHIDLSSQPTSVSPA
jgi:hypothetical protein